MNWLKSLVNLRSDDWDHTRNQFQLCCCGPCTPTEIFIGEFFVSISSITLNQNTCKVSTIVGHGVLVGCNGPCTTWIKATIHYLEGDQFPL